MFKHLRVWLDLLFWDEADQMAAALYKKLASRKNTSWLEDDQMNYEIQTSYKLKKKSHEKIKRLLVTKASVNLTKKCAKMLDVAFESGICVKKGYFIVHNYMNPFMLISEHAGHIMYPLRKEPLFYARGHREWYESLIDRDVLLRDFVASFEAEYSEEIHKDLIRVVARVEEPVKAVLYEVRPTPQ